MNIFSKIFSKNKLELQDNSEDSYVKKQKKDKESDKNKMTSPFLKGDDEEK